MIHRSWEIENLGWQVRTCLWRIEDRKIHPMFWFFGCLAKMPERLQAYRDFAAHPWGRKTAIGRFDQCVEVIKSNNRRLLTCGFLPIFGKGDFRLKVRSCKSTYRSRQKKFNPERTAKWNTQSVKQSYTWITATKAQFCKNGIKTTTESKNTNKINSN